MVYTTVHTYIPYLLNYLLICLFGSQLLLIFTNPITRSRDHEQKERNMTLGAQVETLVLVAVAMALCEYWTWRKVLTR